MNQTHRNFLVLATLLSCTLLIHGAEPTLAPFSLAGADQAPAPWRVVGVPGGKIPLTQFSIVDIDGHRVLRVATDKSYGNLLHPLPKLAAGASLRLTWRWRLDEAIQSANLRIREGDDSPLKVCVLFDMPLERLGLMARNMLRLARAASAEKLPSATLCYVWDNKLAPETLLPNAYTNRVRFIVTTSGTSALGQWVTQSRDVRADFQRAFGSESEVMPPVMAVLVGGDADNTGSASVGFLDDLMLTP